MRTQSLGGEAELVAHGFHALLHDGSTACEFVAKLRELRSVAHGFQPRRLAGASGPLANAFGVGGESNLPAFAKATAWQAVAIGGPARTDDAIVIANFSFSLSEPANASIQCCGEDAATSTRRRVRSPDIATHHREKLRGITARQL